MFCKMQLHFDLTNVSDTVSHTTNKQAMYNWHWRKHLGASFNKS